MRDVINRVTVGIVTLILVGFLLYVTVGVANMTLDMPPVSP